MNLRYVVIKAKHTLRETAIAAHVVLMLSLGLVLLPLGIVVETIQRNWEELMGLLNYNNRDHDFRSGRFRNFR